MAKDNKGQGSRGSNRGQSQAAPARAETKATRQTVTFKDVALSFLMDGMKGVKRLEEELGNKPIAENILWTALESMATQDTEELRDYTVSLYGEPTTGQRGRVAPKVGDKRTYKVQKLDKGEEFLRLPIGALKVAKGGSVNVEYNEGRIVITVAPAGAGEA